MAVKVDQQHADVRDPVPEPPPPRYPVPTMAAGRATVAELQAAHGKQIDTAALELITDASPHIRQLVLLLVGRKFARRHFPDEKARLTLLHSLDSDASTRA